jgi:hypothetical protein
LEIAPAGGQPLIEADLRALIRRMSVENGTVQVSEEDAKPLMEMGFIKI